DSCRPAMEVLCHYPGRSAVAPNFLVLPLTKASEPLRRATATVRQTNVKIDYVAWVAMVIALAGLFWNVNTGFNLVHERIDRLQADTNARFDQMFDRMDRMQAETNRRFDAILETIMGFDRRVSRNEGQIEVIREQLQAEGAP
ncbi:MAG: hypothetical protein OXP66_14315, partial [Candidatus Tectomicrobia bacterium]|nr:hypothetical protein [Candidatus Tectomicrobia bacterium]